jgi:uncharacterized RDD family membrane protein YckC
MTAAEGSPVVASPVVGVPAPARPWHAAAAPSVRDGGRVQGRAAGIVTRSLANVADLGVVCLLVAGGYVGVAAVRFLLRPAAFQFPAPALGTLLIIGLALQAVYFTVTWAVVGGTPGDRLMGLRVTGGSGGRLGWGRSAVRAVLCTLVPIGLLWVAVSPKNRSLQDVLLRTRVAYDWTPA